MNERFRNILLDRDGTVIKERHYLADPNGVQLLPGAGRALRALLDAGHRLFLVTNQSGIGRGYFTLAQFAAVQQRLLQLLRQFRVEFTDTAMCPHAPQEGCQCRKPRIGLWEQLRLTHDLVPEQSIMIGDKIADIRFARRAGLAGSTLVLTGHGVNAARELGWSVADDGRSPTPPPHASDRPDQPDIVAADLAAAARWILTQPEQPPRDGL